MHALIIEDDASIAEFIARGLREAGFAVDVASDGHDGFEAALTQEFDVVIVDLMLPGRDGLSVIDELRRRGRRTPVLILSAKRSVDDRVRGLQAGGDDYLTKPFAFDELLARLRALTRRGRSRHVTAVLTYGPLVLDLEGHTVTADGAELHLSATEYRLLEFLIRRAETVVSRTQLADHVWGNDYDPFSNVADVYVGYLRRKLTAAGVPGTLIQTIRGLGYMLKQPSA